MQAKVIYFSILRQLRHWRVRRRPNDVLLPHPLRMLYRGQHVSLLENCCVHIVLIGHLFLYTILLHNTSLSLELTRL
jgi:hypothetical protein